MTRWARSGNTQHHQKQPNDPTPWAELSQGASTRSNTATNTTNNINKNGVPPVEGTEKSALKKYDEHSGNGSRRWGKKENFYDKVKQRRLENGIMLLPKKEEQKLYEMKKELRAKGCPGLKIKEILRQARRKAELNFKRSLKVCFNCREIGHVLSMCPLIEKDPEQGTGICFKCGTTEHISRQCHIKGSDFPFAKCFICHEQGHLSRKCPKNSHGVFPKGGRCNLCGEIDHMKKDCPLLLKKNIKKKDEITIGTTNGMTSVDDEVLDQKTTELDVNVVKKAKVVKF